MKGKQKISIAGFCNLSPLFQGKLLVVSPGKVDLDTFKLFQCLFHGLCHLECQIFFHVLRKDFSSPVLIPAVTGINYHDDRFLCLRLCFRNECQHTGGQKKYCSCCSFFHMYSNLRAGHALNSGRLRYPVSA